MIHGARVILVSLLACAALLPSVGARAQPRADQQVEETVVPNAEMGAWLRRLVGNYRFEGVVEVVYDDPNYEEHRCGPLPPDPSKQDNPPPPAVPYCSGIKGVGDCVAIGTGPGVQCILNVSWQDLYEVDGKAYNLPGGVAYLDPAMLLLGLDPGKPAINELLVDNKGLPEGSLGVITGNRATFKAPCVNGPALLTAMRPPAPSAGHEDRLQNWRSCERTMRIDAKPDGKVVFLAMDINLNDEPFTRFEMTLRRNAPVPAGDIFGAPPAKR